mgnify:CR=1 FL=1
MATALLLAIAGALAAQVPATAPTCPTPAGAPAGYDGWAALQGVTAGASVAAPATLALGRSARATLLPTDRVTFPAPPGRAAEPATMAGVFAVDADSAGSYRVALSAPVWVDLVAGDKPLASVAHGHGPDCSGIRKTVDFRIPAAGRYLVQVANSAAPNVTVMISRVTD